jgi:hypothetical protein
VAAVAAASTYAVALTAATAATFVAPVDQHAYYAVLTDAAPADGGVALSTLSTAYTAPYRGLAVSSVTGAAYAATFTRTAAATAAATLSFVDTAGGGTVAASKPGAAWSAAGTYTVALTAATASTFTAAVNTHGYYALLADAADGQTLSSAVTLYAAPYTSLAVSTVNAAGYVVTFTRAVAATSTATVSFVDATAGGVTVATNTGSAAWSTPGAYVVALTASTTTSFTAPTSGHAYYALLVDAPDGAALSTGTTTYTAPFSGVALSSVTARTYAVTFTRSLAAHSTASLTVYDASALNATVAFASGAAGWSTAGTYAVALTASTATSFTPPVDGHTYFAQLVDAADAQTVSTAARAYAAPYNALRLSSITGAGYTCAFTRTAAATSSATLAVYDTALNTLVARYTGITTWTAAALSSYTVALTSSVTTGFTGPTGGHAYYLAVADAADDGFLVSSLSTAFVFTPSTINGLTFWLDGANAAALTLSSGTSSVVGYADQSGAGNNASSIGAGSLSAASLPVYGAADHSLSFASSAMLVAGVPAALAADCTWVAVCSVAAFNAQTNCTIMGGTMNPVTTAYGGCQMRAFGTTGWNVNNGGTAMVLTGTGIAPQGAGSTILVSVQFTAANRYLVLREYGHSIASASTVAAFTANTVLMLGARAGSLASPSVAETLTGKLFEVLCYSQNLNGGGEAGDYANVVNYLAAKWGFAVQA